MKKALIIILALLVVAGAAGIVGVNYVGQKVGAIERAHETVLSEYNQMLSSAEGSTVTLTENGVTLGVFSLEDLGILDSTKESIMKHFSVEDRTKTDVFNAKDIDEKVAWNEQNHPVDLLVPVNTLGIREDVILDAINSVERTVSQDAYPVFNGHGYEIVSEVYGNDLDADSVMEKIRPMIDQMVISAEKSASVLVDISELDCYHAPSVTADNNDFDFDKALQDDVQSVSYTVDLNLPGQSYPEKFIEITGDTLKSFVSLDDDGNISVDRTAIQKLAQTWIPQAEVKDTNYILDTYVDGPKPMPFLKVDYTMTPDAAVDTICEDLKTLTSADVSVDFTCTKSNGEPFSLGETYIEVDIDNQKLTMYKDGKVLISTDVVTGNLNGHQTITGLYNAYNKDTDQTMLGEDYVVFSKYWIGILGGYGIHDASWRNHFGKDFYVNGGSHGCVNVPVDAMPTIFENTEVGTPIILFGENKWYQPDPETTRILQTPGL